MPSPRVLDASINNIERLPPALPTSLQRVVLSNNRLASLAGLEQLRNLKVRPALRCGRLAHSVRCRHVYGSHRCARAGLRAAHPCSFFTCPHAGAGA